MKLMIDIPEEQYRTLNAKTQEEVVTAIDNKIIITAVKNGVPLLESEDCVKRNSITEVLNKMDRYVADELTLCDTERKFPKNEVFIVDDVYEEIVEQLPPVTPQPKMGQWILVQRGKYIDLNCSECGHTRVKEFAYNYTVDEIDMQEVKDWIITNNMNYCEYCSAKMGGEQNGITGHS